MDYSVGPQYFLDLLSSVENTNGWTSSIEWKTSSNTRKLRNVIPFK
jgi:hypothetical protein